MNLSANLSTFMFEFMHLADTYEVAYRSGTKATHQGASSICNIQ